MKIQQLRLSRMATFCYVVADERSGSCALIDPAFDTKRILAEVQSAGYEVSHIINTHGHSDHTAGNAAIKAATGADILIHEQDARRLEKGLNKVFSRVLGGRGSPKPDVLVTDGDLIAIGETQLTVIHTPGHTPGGICLYGDGHVFTGDTLFVGAVGRTDLAGGSMKQLIDSVRERLYTLPDETVVWPGHDYGASPKSTIKRERETNPFTL